MFWHIREGLPLWDASAYTIQILLQMQIPPSFSSLQTHQSYQFILVLFSSSQNLYLSEKYPMMLSNSSWICHIYRAQYTRHWMGFDLRLVGLHRVMEFCWSARILNLIQKSWMELSLAIFDSGGELAPLRKSPRATTGSADLAIFRANAGHSRNRLFHGNIDCYRKLQCHKHFQGGTTSHKQVYKSFC